jgi:hypothetical protein
MAVVGMLEVGIQVVVVGIEEDNPVVVVDNLVDQVDSLRKD